MRIRKWPIAVAIAALLLTAGMSPANASTVSPANSSPSVPPGATTVPMAIDCSTVTPAGREYAKKHHVNFCGVLSKSTSTVTPFDSVANNCGDAFIYMSQGSADAEAYIEWGISSTTGTIVHFDLYVHYDGSAGSGVIPDSGNWPGTGYGTSADVFTGRGAASTELEGTVETILYNCVVENPSSGAFIV